mmetsp:Transcript_2691/g.6492  ORF Transcript_2691/g.6492 Transcript_2691/m.6492 type:complete len:282 (+) Transcript_2691:326-1171(+)
MSLTSWPVFLSAHYSSPSPRRCSTFFAAFADGERRGRLFASISTVTKYAPERGSWGLYTSVDSGSLASSRSIAARQALDIGLAFVVALLDTLGSAVGAVLGLELVSNLKEVEEIAVLLLHCLHRSLESFLSLLQSLYITFFQGTDHSSHHLELIVLHSVALLVFPVRSMLQHAQPVVGFFGSAVLDERVELAGSQVVGFLHASLLMLQDLHAALEVGQSLGEPSLLAAAVLIGAVAVCDVAVPVRVHPSSHLLEQRCALIVLGQDFLRHRQVGKLGVQQHL